MQKSILFFLVLLTVTTVFGQSVIRRACFDIGSGSTKMVVADVDLAKNTVQVIYEESEQVSYKEDLDKAKDNRFSAEIQLHGLLILSKLKQNALKQGATQFAGVATEAFRVASNGQEVVDNITRRLGIFTTIISQKEEGLIGFAAAIVGEDKPKESLVVWDIGGGSMQIISQEGPNTYEFYFGKLASKSIANYIIQDIQGKDLKVVNTPNPISESDCKSALLYAQTEAKKVNDVLKTKMQNPNTLVIGIGGVHYYSIRGQIGGGVKEYSLEVLQQTLAKQLNKNDAQIGGQFANTEVGNLILVRGFMEGLNISKVKIKKINNAHGVLTLGQFWK